MLQTFTGNALLQKLHFPIRLSQLKVIDNVFVILLSYQQMTMPFYG